jgi:hypothetical protein
VVQIKGQILFKEEIITKMGCGHLKVSFSRTRARIGHIYMKAF